MPPVVAFGSVRVVLLSRSWISSETVRCAAVALPAEDTRAMLFAELQTYSLVVLVLLEPMRGFGRRMLFHTVPAIGAAAE